MRAVRLWVLASAPLRKTCVSRTTLGSGGTQRLVDDGRHRRLSERAGTLTRALDNGVEIIIRQRLERAVDLPQAHSCGEQQRQYFVREGLPLIGGQRLDFLGEMLHFRGHGFTLAPSEPRANPDAGGHGGAPAARARSRPRAGRSRSPTCATPARAGRLIWSRTSPGHAPA